MRMWLAVISRSTCQCIILANGSATSSPISEVWKSRMTQVVPGTWISSRFVLPSHLLDEHLIQSWGLSIADTCGEALYCKKTTKSSEGPSDLWHGTLETWNSRFGLNMLCHDSHGQSEQCLRQQLSSGRLIRERHRDFSQQISGVSRVISH